LSMTMRLGLPAVSRRDRQRKGELMCRVMLGHASMDAPPPQVRQQTRDGG
jgi:hypothetical protein